MISTHYTMDLLSKNSFTGDSAVTIVTYTKVFGICYWLHSVITVMISTHYTMDFLSKNSFTGDSAVTIVTYTK